MQHECKITVIDKKCFTDYQEQYLADPKSGSCPFFNEGDEFVLKRTSQQDDFYHLMDGKFCGEAWDAVSRYVYLCSCDRVLQHMKTKELGEEPDRLRPVGCEYGEHNS